MKSKLLVLVAATATLEYRQKVLEEMTAKMGDVCEVVVGTPDELSVHAEAPVLVDVPVYEIQNRVMDNYVPRNLPSKKRITHFPVCEI